MELPVTFTALQRSTHLNSATELARCSTVGSTGDVCGMIGDIYRAILVATWKLFAFCGWRPSKLHRNFSHIRLMYSVGRGWKITAHLLPRSAHTTQLLLQIIFWLITCSSNQLSFPNYRKSFMVHMVTG